MKKNWPISRRAFIKTSSAMIGLPFLEAMVSPLANALNQSMRSPKRFVVCYIPNGVIGRNWFPTLAEEERKASISALPYAFESLQARRENMLFISNVNHIPAVKDRWDGNGSAHAFAASSYLTCAELNSRSREYQAGKSIDQFIADKLSSRTRISSLELGCDPSNLSQPCISFSPVYPQTISWRTENSPNPKEINPKKVFDRLFLVSEEQATSRESILDSVLEPVNDLIRRKGLSSSDQLKIDEYLTAIRESEVAIQTMYQPLGNLQTERAYFEDDPGEDYRKKLRMMFRLMFLALKSDSTRVITFQLGQEISTRVYDFLEISENHHDLSHYRTHKGTEYVENSLSKINRFHADEFALFVDQLANESENDGNMLENSLILYGGGMSDGNSHGLGNLPLLLMGGKKSSDFAWGHHIQAMGGATLANLHLSIARTMGLNLNMFSDTSAELSEIFA